MAVPINVFSREWDRFVTCNPYWLFWLASLFGTRFLFPDQVKLDIWSYLDLIIFLLSIKIKYKIAHRMLIGLNSVCFLILHLSRTVNQILEIWKYKNYDNVLKSITLTDNDCCNGTFLSNPVLQFIFGTTFLDIFRIIKSFLPEQLLHVMLTSRWTCISW